MKASNGHDTYLEVQNWASSFLGQVGVDEQVARWLMRELLDLTPTDLVLKRNQPMPDSDRHQYEVAVKKAATHYPAQYIVGHEWFLDHKFKVSPDTLIPRPETEEWVDRYLRDLPDRPLTVVDVGTGTGAIGISHKLARPDDQVILTDLSPAALDVAKENAKNLGADVQFLGGSTLEPLIDRGIKVDLLVSNPPYISDDEWDLMDKSVQKYEPKSALFADNQGLAIYDKLLNESSRVVKDNGTILLEIGFNQAEAVKAILSRLYPQAYVKTWTDFNGLDRLIRAVV